MLKNLTRDLAERHSVSEPRYTDAALRLLGAYPWPGNIRELSNLCERMAILRSGLEVGPQQLPLEIRSDTSSEPSQGFNLPRDGVALEDVETQLIRQALERTSGNRSRAARLLGLTRDTLLYRLKKYHLTEHALRN